MNKKLFVGSLSYDTNDQSLEAFFSQAGKVESAHVITDRYSGRSKGFGFVEMSTVEEAEKAKQELNGQMLDGRAIVVHEAKPQEDRPQRDNRSFNGNGNRNGGGYNGGGQRNRY